MFWFFETKSRRRSRANRRTDLGWSWSGNAGPGLTGLGEAWHGSALQGEARLGTALQGEARRGLSRQCKARFLDQSRDKVLAVICNTGPGDAGPGKAWSGTARSGKVRQGFILKGCDYETGSM